MMFASPTRRPNFFVRLTAILIAAAVCSVLAAGVAYGQAQANAADLKGFVRDPSGAVVVGATVTARNPATNFSRTATTNDEGYYQLVSLPPGDYEVTVEAPNYKKAVVPEYKLTVGASADLDVALELGQITEIVNISSEDQPVVETTRTTVANTIEQERIENLPINQRDYLGFSTTISTVNRGNDRPIGPAPSSGLNIGGQRGRSTLVQVDGADNTDNSVNAARSTVSQEAVQEFQVATNSYAPEFGRATGGIINVVTKGGTNEFRGNIFGFIRHSSIQARNALAPIIDNDPSKKPPFTRAQYGATLGGPLVRDRTFFFGAFEQRRRQESGFFTSDVAGGLSASAGIPAIPGLNPFARNFTNITPAQAAFINGLVAAGAPLLGNPATAMQGGRLICLARTYGFFTSVAGSIGLNGASPLASPNDGSVCPAFSPIPPGTIGGRFLLAGTPVPTAANNLALPNFITVNEAGQPIGFRPLNQLQRVFPVSESSSFFSLRGDHRVNDRNQLSLRFGYNPSDITGIQDESQNQTLGQNDFSRTGIQTLRDTTFSTNLTSTITSTIVNEARFQFGRRKATFDSQIPSVALQISGAAFIGSNPFSPVDRVEDRFQIADNVNWVIGNHSTKFGADFNFINVDATFELNFPGLFNFSTFALQPVITGLPANAPPLTPIQSYGLGFPSVFIQGFGDPRSSIKNRPLAFFAQDSWKVRPNLTLNYGVRYDVELTDTIAPIGFTDPLTGVTLTAENMNALQNGLGIQQGFPRDTNNIAPRFGLAWDIGNDGKTVLRAAYGIFYDHPLLAVAFNSDIADASQQQQYTNVLPISPAPNATLNLLNIFQGTVCTAATTNAVCPPGVSTPGAAASAQYLPGRLIFNDQTFVGFGPVFPFTLNVAQDFEYAYANQANLTIERQLGKNLSFSASWIFVGAHHLPHPQDINAPRSDLISENFRRFAANNPVLCPTGCPNGRPPTGLAEAVLFPIPLASNALYTVRIPGLVAVNNTNGQVIVSPLAANFFRPNAPNYFFVLSATGGLVSPAAFNAAIAGSVRTPGAITPFGDVSAQLSDGNSNYNALNLELKRRFSRNYQFLASYTWSHSIDDSSDLQTLLKPLNNRNFRGERSDSLFDQRHRFVFSGVATSPSAWRSSSSGFRRFLADFTIAPIVEISSGRPFNILTGIDQNLDLQSSNERPSVAADGTLILPPFLTDGSLGRNRGITHSYASVDLRVMRAIRFGERFKLDLIAEGFNLFNRFNEAAANPFFDVVNSFGERGPGGRYYSQPTAAYDPRQFQFGIKLNF
ncbi:MAG TPA: TonB-dependent receptor [Pyrinomonadaceae bacterium]|nr:TonB-dependent receptor [Pyrinomonadaceae bacterium]